MVWLSCYRWVNSIYCLNTRGEVWELTTDLSDPAAPPLLQCRVPDSLPAEVLDKLGYADRFPRF